MVWGTIKNALGMGEPTLPDGPTRLPEYFPVEPKGCEKHAQKLFSCLANEATDKARDMERVGYHKSYFPDVSVHPVDPQAAQAVADDPNNPDAFIKLLHLDHGAHCKGNAGHVDDAAQLGRNQRLVGAGGHR